MQKKNTTDEQLKEAKKFIDQNWKSIKNVRQIAKFTGKNYHTLRRRFRRKFGITLIGYVVKKKIDYSIRYLRKDKLQLYKIAPKLGFKSVEGFIKSFIKLKGNSPTEYRQKLMEKK